ncbi:MAG TPA: hypothetical protein VF209_04035 [Patescibacteria group bacterium]
MKKSELLHKSPQDLSITHLNLDEHEFSDGLDSVRIHTLGDPTTEERGIYLLSFSTEKEILAAMIPQYAQLINDRLEAGFETFYVVQSPHGAVTLSSLISMYLKASEQLPYIRSISAVDISGIEGQLAMPAILTSIRVLTELMDTDVQLFNSREEAVQWVRSQQKENI